MPGRILRIDPQTAAGDKPKGLWENRAFDRIDSLAVTDGAVLAAGRLAPGASDRGGSFVVAALDPASGKPMWSVPLPGETTSWGLAVTRNGRIVVTLEDGRVLCFGS